MKNNKLSFAQRMGITRTVVRPPEEAELCQREDRVGQYFKKYLKKFVFVEFSPEFLEKTHLTQLMAGVPIPLRKEDLEVFAGGEGLSPNHIGENMAWIMGADPHFKYTKDYVAYLKKVFNHKIIEGMLKIGRNAAEKDDFDNACIHFRACLCMQPDYLHAMYSYARVCRSMYLQGKDNEYVGRFKAEALDYFELVTETHPRFAQGYYYLGYAYLNLGLYGKAQAAWQSFLRFTRNGKDRREINKRMKQLKDPVEIEHGCNLVSTGKYEAGLEVLEKYSDSKFNDWWPLHYYLGAAYVGLGQDEKGEASLKEALKLNGSHLESMEELLTIYQARGDREKVEKYENKIALIQDKPKSKKKKKPTNQGKKQQGSSQKESDFVPEIQGLASQEERTKGGVKKLNQKK